MQFSGAYRFGAALIALSGGLHVLAPSVSGLSGAGWALVPFGAAYLAVAWGLLQGWRWLAYLAFLAFGVLGAVALSRVWSVSDVPGWWFAIIACANWGAALALLPPLWRAKTSSVSIR